MKEYVGIYIKTEKSTGTRLGWCLALATKLNTTSIHTTNTHKYHFFFTLAYVGLLCGSGAIDHLAVFVQLIKEYHHMAFFRWQNVYKIVVKTDI